MRHARAIGVAGLAALVAGAVAFAQSTVEPLEENPPVEVSSLDASALAALKQTHAGDPENGATLAGTCAACHGLDGNPPEGLPYPRIAGQSERYISQQLALFKSGERNTGLAAAMIPFATPLSPQDMRDLGAFFATKSPGAGIADDGLVEGGAYDGMKFYEIGQQLYRTGDAARGVPACLACHGPAGQGNPGPAYPAVAGQESAYVERRLQGYRSGETSLGDRHLFDIMAEVAAPLTDQEIQALASYLQGLHQRPDAATLAAIESARASAPAPAPATEAAPEAAPAEGEQPTTDEAPAQG
ncbi:c-type cytochrome [Luteimonas composti]|uniref:C-type cytochrome n=1 Tax=Luteimonas composti TaxID=398257 RepID=A0ABT6MNP2_9GAMM|nr:c-type cytochrome [Luteimonas composti]MDH7452174.1 c-type cytochrome [Luteimonas composti]